MKTTNICGVVLLGLATCLGGLTACNGDDDATIGATSTNENPGATTSALELKNSMRRLWTEHVLWTRVFIMDDIAGTGDVTVDSDRLMQNQVDIGDAMKPFYGDAAAAQLTALLKQHISGAVAVLTAAKAGNQHALAKANVDWYANADRIASFLADANPELSLASLKEMMVALLDQTEAEATARLQRDWTADVAAYDAIVAHVQMMSDALTAGVEAQFPDMIARDEVTAGDANLDVEMRALWEDHVMWTRVFLIDAAGGLADTTVATNRLLQNQVDIGDAIAAFYGDAAGAELTALLKQHILLAAAVVAEAKVVGNIPDPKSADPLTRWYENATAIADFFAELDPKLDRA